MSSSTPDDVDLVAGAAALERPLGVPDDVPDDRPTAGEVTDGGAAGGAGASGGGQTAGTEPPHPLLERMERLETSVGLDRFVSAVGGSLPRSIVDEPGRRLLGGAWLGHALHPLLTDFPLGAWTSATLLDLVGGPGARPYATLLVGFGDLAAVPTALAGWSDWSVADRRSQRVGLVHAAVNGTALTMYTMSFLARLRRRYLLGAALGFGGGVAAVVGGYLGGHLTLIRGTGVEASADVIDLDAPTVASDDDRHGRDEGPAPADQPLGSASNR